jgi:hypothetical protein
MAYSRSHKVPGVYIEPEPKRIEPISLTNKCIAGFIGFAEKGPLHKGIKISSFYEFQNIFGSFTEYAYLAYSVYGFFNSGGRECIVVRTAHYDSENNESSAQKASHIISGETFKSAYELYSLSEGTVGNFTGVKLWYDFISSSYVTSKSSNDESDEWLEVESSHDFLEGEWVCIEKNTVKEYRIISKIEESKIYLDKKLQYEFDPENQDIFVNKISINIIFHNKKEKIFEEYFQLSPIKSNERYFVKIINSRSQLCEIIEKSPGSLPMEFSYVHFKGGKNGILGSTPADFIGHYNGLNDTKGIGIFESYEEINLICAPDVLAFEELIESDNNKSQDMIYAVQRAIIDQCEKLDNRFAILDTPHCSDVLELMKWRERFDTQYAALYYPKIDVINPDDMTTLSSIRVPPSGHIAGVYAETDEEEGIFRAPANRFVKGAVGIDIFVEDEEYEILYPKGINCLQYVPGRGIKVWGARTLSSNIEWRYINVRRTFSAIKRSLRFGTGWAVFEPNSSDLRKRVIRHINAFLIELWRKGYFAGVEPEDGYYIRCDDELNPPEEIDAGRIHFEIGIAIARPAEFLVINLQADGESNIVTYDDDDFV